jgi:DNA polymerase V
MIGLVDGNNFYVSCERIFNLKLEGRPVAVLSNNDGCVISRSYEFKALDISMGTPYFKLKPLIDKHGIAIKSSNYELYGDISRRIISVLQEHCHDVEQYSIDEAFVYMDLHKGYDVAEYEAFGRLLRSRVLNWVGVPCGVGFAKTKTLAKIANHIGKKLPSGVFVMPENPKAVLENLSIDEVWGIGRRLATRLQQMGIMSAWQFANLDRALIQKKFSITQVKTADELLGIPRFERENPEEPSQSISCSRSYGYPVEKIEEIRESVAHYIAQAAEKLRNEKLRAAGASIYLQYYPEYGQYAQDGGYVSTVIAFASATNATSIMLSSVLPAVDALFIKGRRYKKSGVLFYGLESESIQQLELFRDEAVEAQKVREERLARVVDTVNNQLGRNTLFYLSEGIERPWQMRREFLTPDYTTSWDDLPVANC